MSSYPKSGEKEEEDGDKEEEPTWELVTKPEVPQMPPPRFRLSATEWVVLSAKAAMYLDQWYISWSLYALLWYCG